MGIKNTLEKHIIEFGKNNSPTLVAMSIAAAKGIFRPIFTMSDKNENYETKRYTALREGLTEIIAIPVYYISGKFTTFVSKKLASPKNFMSKKTYQEFMNGNLSSKVQDSYKHAEELSKINLPKISTNSAFIGVCVSALFIIPYVCSVAINPLMTVCSKKSDNEKQSPKPACKVNNVFTKRIGNQAYNLHYFNSTSGIKVGKI